MVVNECSSEPQKEGNLLAIWCLLQSPSFSAFLILPIQNMLCGTWKVKCLICHYIKVKTRSFQPQIENETENINTALPKNIAHYKLLGEMADILEQFYKTLCFPSIFFFFILARVSQLPIQTHENRPLGQTYMRCFLSILTQIN